ncbi:hypothetical protein BC829DRAFT_432063 [Chytridium lagenaria]|nr:hypothetical protein BC829DRAFT_432063 [Chytridium lagenaria]
MNIEVGSRVELITPSSVSQVGIVRFVRETSFTTGNWVGVELDSPNGKNDGSVQGQRVRGESASRKNDEDWEPQSKQTVISPMSPSPALPLPSDLVRDHKNRIQALETMQKEDKDKLKDFEKLKAELKNVNVARALEMMTLDKEMAEERADALQTEHELANEKIEELGIELEVLKEERGWIVIFTDTDGVNADNQVLSRQNDRLREALVRLRDLSAKQETESKEVIAELRHEDTLMEQLEKAEVQIEHLSESSDNALGAEQMKLEELKSTIADLEALRDLNDELEENHILVGTERRLRRLQRKSQRFRQLETVEKRVGRKVDEEN